MKRLYGIGGLALFLLGCFAEAEYVAPGGGAGIYVSMAPPPLRVETPLACGAGMLYVPGEWDWSGTSWYWRPGRCDYAPAGMVWIRPYYYGGRYYRGFWGHPGRYPGRAYYAPPASRYNPTYVAPSAPTYVPPPPPARTYVPPPASPGYAPAPSGGYVAPPPPRYNFVPPPAPPVVVPPPAPPVVVPPPAPRVVVTPPAPRVVVTPPAPPVVVTPPAPRVVVTPPAPRVVVTPPAPPVVVTPPGPRVIVPGPAPGVRPRPAGSFVPPPPPRRF